jgi:hypothetical protein
MTNTNSDDLFGPAPEIGKDICFYCFGYGWGLKDDGEPFARCPVCGRGRGDSGDTAHPPSSPPNSPSPLEQLISRFVRRGYL